MVLTNHVRSGVGLGGDLTVFRRLNMSLTHFNKEYISPEIM